ncbi:hypothetical protein E4U54_003420 [Claviceps lovelessii]|nr:hypothetical protein E4U54_003420 [Claviceps lovelessii]
MKFSSSAALGALALFAGQTFAAVPAGDCQENRQPDGNQAYGYDCNLQGDGTWACPDGAVVRRSGATKIRLTAGGERTYVVVTCDDLKPTPFFSCAAHNSGVQLLPCTNNRILRVQLFSPTQL